MYVETDWEDIRSRIATGTFEVGDEIKINHCFWRVLDVSENEIFIWNHHCDCRGPREFFQFSEADSNDYEDSDLQKYACGEFLKTVPAEMLELVTEEGFSPLSLDEVYMYLSGEDERTVSDGNGYMYSWWTRSGDAPDTDNAWYVGKDGNPHLESAVYDFCFAPACRLRVKPE